MNKCFYAFLIFLLNITHVLAYNGSIKGIVYDQESHLPLFGTTIVIEASQQGVSTDIFGLYQFTNLSAGTYQLKISFIGYQTQWASVIVKDDEMAMLSTYLTSSQFELSEVSV